MTFVQELIVAPRHSKARETHVVRFIVHYFGVKVARWSKREVSLELHKVCAGPLVILRQWYIKLIYPTQLYPRAFTRAARAGPGRSPFGRNAYDFFAGPLSFKREGAGKKIVAAPCEMRRRHFT